MSLLGIDPDAVPERENLPAGDYEARITSLKCLDDEGKRIISATGRKMIKGTLKVLNQTANTVFFMLMENVKGDDDDFVLMNKERIRDFIRCFGLDSTLAEQDLCEAAPGSEGNVKLRLKSDPEYGDRNEVDRFLTS